MIKAIISGDYTTSDIPIFGTVIIKGSSADVPIFMFLIFIIFIFAATTLIVTMGYCRFVKHVGVCDKCW